MSFTEDAELIAQQDIYGNVKPVSMSPHLQIEVDSQNYDDENLEFDQRLYANSFEKEFARGLQNAKLTQSCRSVLMEYYRIATSDDVVLGNYTPTEARIFVEQLELDLEREKMGLRRKDMLSWTSGAWDTAARQIITACKSRINRSIGGWERTALITSRSYVKQDTLNEEKLSSEERDRGGLFSKFGNKRK